MDSIHYQNNKRISEKFYPKKQKNKTNNLTFLFSIELPELLVR